MGVGGIGIWQLLIVLVIVLLLFGTKKLRNLGGDLGTAIKNFKSSVKTGESDSEEDKQETTAKAEELAHGQNETMNRSEAKEKEKA